MKNKILIFNVTIVTLALLVIFFSDLSVNKKSHREEAEKNIVAITQITSIVVDNILITNCPDVI